MYVIVISSLGKREKISKEIYYIFFVCFVGLRILFKSIIIINRVHFILCRYIYFLLCFTDLYEIGVRCLTRQGTTLTRALLIFVCFVSTSEVKNKRLSRLSFPFLIYYCFNTIYQKDSMDKKMLNGILLFYVF